MFQIDFDAIVFQEGSTFIAYSPKLDLSSCGNTIDEARKNLSTAVRLFLDEAAKMGTLDLLPDTFFAGQPPVKSVS